MTFVGWLVVIFVAAGTCLIRLNWCLRSTSSLRPPRVPWCRSDADCL